MDVVLIAAAGVLAPLVVFAIWRRIPPDPDMKLWLAYWASRLRPGRKTAAKSEARVDPVDHTGTPLSASYSRRAPRRTRCGWAGKGVGPGRDPNGFDTTACCFCAAQGGQAVQGEIAVSKQQPTGPTVAGRRRYEWLHPSQFPGGLPSMPGIQRRGEQPTATPAGEGS